MIVLDTNVLSELSNEESDPHVLAWIERQDPQDLWITSTTVSELVLGVKLLPAGRRRETLDAANLRLLAGFYDGTLSFESHAASEYGELVAKLQIVGRRIKRADAQIAASCLVSGAALATRNTKDFDGIPGLELINPWEFEN